MNIVNPYTPLTGHLSENNKSFVLRRWFVACIIVLMFIESSLYFTNPKEFILYKVIVSAVVIIIINLIWLKYLLKLEIKDKTLPNIKVLVSGIISGYLTMGLVAFAVLLPYLFAAYELQRKMENSGAMGVTSSSKISGPWWSFLLPALIWGLITFVCFYKYSNARHNE